MSNTVIITHSRLDGSAYNTVYAKSEVYCPHCGEQTVWISSCTDYYLGNIGTCTSCEKYHWSAGEFYEADKFVIEMLKGEITHAS